MLAKTTTSPSESRIYFIDPTTATSQALQVPYSLGIYEWVGPYVPSTQIYWSPDGQYFSLALFGDRGHSIDILSVDGKRMFVDPIPSWLIPLWKGPWLPLPHSLLIADSQRDVVKLVALDVATGERTPIAERVALDPTSGVVFHSFQRPEWLILPIRVNADQIAVDLLTMDTMQRIRLVERLPIPNGARIYPADITTPDGKRFLLTIKADQISFMMWGTVDIVQQHVTIDRIITQPDGELYADWLSNHQILVQTARPNSKQRDGVILDIITGKRVALAGFTDGYFPLTNDGIVIAVRDSVINVFRIDDGHYVSTLRVTDNFWSGWPFFPSPDGRSALAHLRRIPGDANESISLFTSDEPRVVWSGMAVTDPSWHPDGTRFAFAYPDYPNWWLRIAAANGRDLQTLPLNLDPQHDMGYEFDKVRWTRCD